MRNLSLATTGMTVAVMALASVDALSFLGPLQGPALMTMSFCWVAYGAVRSMSGVKPKVQSSPSKVPVRSWCRRHLIPPSPTRMGMSPVTRRRPVFLRGNRTSQPISMPNLAVVHSRRGRLASAQQVCEQAVDLFRMSGDSRGQADVMLTLGNIQTHQGELDKARKTYEAAMKCHQMVGSDMGRANARGNLGNLCLQTGDLEQALSYHRAALAIHEQTGNPVGRANALSNIGNVRLREQKFDEAQRSYKAALEIFRQGEHAKALDMYERGLSIHTQIGNPHGRATALTNLGSLLSRMKRRDEALEALDEARKLYLELGVRSHGAKAVEELIERLGGSRAQKVKDAKEAVAQADAEDADTGSADAGSAS